MTVTAGGVGLHASAAQAEPPVAPAGASVTKATESAGTATAVKAAETAKTAGTAKAAKTAKRSKAARQQVKAHKAVAVAKKQIGDPYRYGATGPHAFDCSGLVQFAWKKAGVSIPRVTNSQFAHIKKKVSYKNLRPGDLMFFRGLGHVGMYIGKGKMVHSPSSGKTVRVEKVSGWRKSSFAGAVRPGL
ncbi:C40 family peptidase [Nonomuraea sp. MCN248]|uniref:C40 family peptidase n=1 Tax=Nonomuraea corallina TaxID=2989783 RepID=A0ABT4SE12_9ACTN|nr:C40 family peptidase [Nonomuraea corallina]MDA0635437.1 C40 family peptidase [Nonomuraea corallina]